MIKSFQKLILGAMGGDRYIGEYIGVKNGLLNHDSWNFYLNLN